MESNLIETRYNEGASITGAEGGSYFITWPEKSLFGILSTLRHPDSKIPLLTMSNKGPNGVEVVVGGQLHLRDDNLPTTATSYKIGPGEQMQFTIIGKTFTITGDATDKIKLHQA